MHSHSHKDTHAHKTSCCSGNSCSSTTVENSKNVSHDSSSHEHSHDDKSHAHDDDETSHQHGSCCNSAPAANDDVEPTQTAKQRFSWIVRGMDCPSCAAKIENAITQIREVAQAKVLFATEKLVVDADKDVTAIVRSTVEAAGYELHDVGSNSAASTPPSLLSEAKPVIILAILMAISWGLEFVNPQLGNVAFILTTLFGLYPIARKSLRLIRTGSPFAIETLMTVAAVGAIFIQATEEAAMVILLFMLGEMLESYSAGRARRGVSALMALVPEDAVLIKDGQKTSVPVAQLRPGDIIEIAPGGRLPTDAVLVSGFASFDESALTGESVPVERSAGEKVAAGCLSVDKAVQMEVVSEQGQNAIDRILQLIEEAEERRAPIERFIDRFSRIYTPIIMLISALVIVIPPLFFSAAWDTWIYRGLTLLLIGCPCALVISTPAAITSALATATRRGALIKGGAALEQLGTVTTIALDKTGTLTEGKPHVTDVVPVEGMSESELIRITASVEVGSHHPLAKAIVNKAEELSITVEEALERKALAGKGVEGSFNGKQVLVSAPSRVEPPLNSQWQAKVEALEAQGKTVVVTLEDNHVIGLTALQDTLRSDAADAMAMLKSLNVNAVMLTGDNPRAASAIANQLGMEFRAGLLPEDKVTAVMELNRNHNTMMVGDGINDAPAMKASSIGVAMGGGTDVALETADAALTHNRLTGLPEIVALSRATRKIIRENITIALGLKAVFLVTSLLGITGLWVAVLADSGATALVTANAVRLLRVKLPEIKK
ncbi:TPA: zinc/cadmium/mercury/lead-transporting ATPase [Providencia alcalifaciens]|uniref:zinc/cadmium/mercury/lead-transporting ATPase n=1 Tax=Providencia alcalifaciens TaxID=126385 RepID=UPI00029C27F0|nr:zinc/cadmium/mercury/lead-transporting ATPase [Providencia alcalifaciens]EKT64030.1 zinc/cadmium/mercury/lead-transporting ATPase [Providencia alcalifaciens Dmel2]EUD05485.1 lead, cadmium, zinc and mercury-transporting ATPase [Providencia alcalifaciens R90-1475]CAG9428040.1 Zinc/cadmium/lead-transporting P-type ATPase [Providencia alcalifaciens]CAG9431787.1 Zinc/cadmium/lead-transporting P-type ATPase [Providencia alcalifaciens]CAG9431955.1 Zinc/cadmium/lead-transporting P-type ATPase [Prov